MEDGDTKEVEKMLAIEVIGRRWDVQGALIDGEDGGECGNEGFEADERVRRRGGLRCYLKGRGRRGCGVMVGWGWWR